MVLEEGPREEDWSGHGPRHVTLLRCADARDHGTPVPKRQPRDESNACGRGGGRQTSPEREDNCTLSHSLVPQDLAIIRSLSRVQPRTWAGPIRSSRFCSTPDLIDDSPQPAAPYRRTEVGAGCAFRSGPRFSSSSMTNPRGRVRHGAPAHRALYVPVSFDPETTCSLTLGVPEITWSSLLAGQDVCRFIKGAFCN